MTRAWLALALAASAVLAGCSTRSEAESAPRPADGYPPDEHDLTHGGLPTVLSQTFRALIQSRMQAGMKGYKQRFPDADVLLFEPDRGDEALFFQNVFRYADRRRLAEHAYQRTRRDRVCAGGGGGSGMQHVRNERKAAQDDLRVTSPSLESSDSLERTCLWNGIES